MTWDIFIDEGVGNPVGNYNKSQGSILNQPKNGIQATESNKITEENKRLQRKGCLPSG